MNLQKEQFHFSKNLDCEIIFEPGRFLTANGGILVTEVLYNKTKW